MPNLESKTIQETEIQTPKNEKTEDFWYNPEIKKIWDNLAKKFPKDFDQSTFDYLVKNILSLLEEKYSEDNAEKLFLQYGEKSFDELMKDSIQYFKDKNFRIFSAAIKDAYDLSNIDNTKSNIDNIIKNIKPLYDNFDSKYKWTSEELANFKKEKLDKDKEDKLRKYWVNPDDYIKYRFAAQKLANSNEAIPNKYEFIKSFNQLNKFLDIDVQIALDDRDKKRNEILKSKPNSLSDLKNNSESVLQNKHIKSFVLDDQKFVDKLDTQQYPKKIIELYAVDNPKLWELLKYVNEDLSINNELLNKEIEDDKEREKVIKDITEKINQIFEDSSNLIQGDTNKWFKEKIMTNCFQALANYFDNTTPNMENFAKDFKMDINQDISFDGKTIYMQWSINWNHVWLYYNLETWEMKMDDFMSYQNQDNWWTYVMWIKNGQKEKLKFKLPTIDELKHWSWDVDIGKHIENSYSILDYEKNIKSDLDSNISKKFLNVNLNKYYIEQFNEKNIAEQSALSDIFYNWQISNGIPIIDFTKETKISKDLQAKQYELLRLVFNSLENYRDPDKLRKFRNCIARLNLIINTNEVKEWRSNEDMFNKLFDSNNMKESMYNWKNNQWEINYFHFFDLMSKWIWDERTINLDVFNKILTIVEKKEEINDNTKLAWYDWFMDRYREKYYNPMINI